MDFDQFTKIAIDDLLMVDNSKIQNALGVVPDSVKTLLVIKAFSANRQKLESLVNSFAESQCLSLKVNDIFVDNNNSKSDFYIGGSVDGVDYINIIKKVLPLVHLDESQSEMNEFLNALFFAMNSEIKSLEDIIKAIDESFINEFLSFLLDQNSEKITDALENFAESKGIPISLDYLDIEVA